MTALARIPNNRNPLEILDKSSLESIDSTSVRILEEVGVKFDDGKPLEQFARESCQVDHARRVVRIGRNLVDGCLKRVPRSFSLYTRRLDEMRVGEGDFYFVSAIDNSHFLDAETRQRRAENWAILRILLS